MLEVVATLTETLSLRVATRSIPDPPRTLTVPQHEVDEQVTGELGFAEGQSFIIEYVNSSGDRSTRQITVLKIKAGAAGVPLLYAKCHQRQRVISFRTDRIVCCIDFDGEVYEDVPAFLFDNFGMSVAAASRTSTSEDSRNWDSFRATYAWQLVLLSALSHADATMLPSEVDAIVQYAAWEAERSGIHTTDAFCRLAENWTKRLRPDREHIAMALYAIRGDTPDQLVRFLRAAMTVVDADGQRHPAEKALLNDLAVELIGTSLL